MAMELVVDQDAAVEAYAICDDCMLKSKETNTFTHKDGYARLRFRLVGASGTDSRS